MISVRLSEEEHLALRRLCAVTGARSVSEFTRDSIRVMLNGANRDQVLGINIDEFRAQMKNMNKKIESLTAEIATFKPGRGV